LVTPLSDKHALYRYKGIPGGAYATFITNEGARKILKPAQHTFYPIDILMGCYWKTCADWLVVSPAIATHNDEVESFIGDARFENNSDLTGILKIIYPFTRGLFKISETILKTLWYYGFYFKDKRSYDVKEQSTTKILKKPETVENDGEGWLVIDDLVDTGKTFELAREHYPKAHYACIYVKPMGAKQTDTYITEFTQDTWVHFPWDMENQYITPVARQDS